VAVARRLGPGLGGGRRRVEARLQGRALARRARVASGGRLRRETRPLPRPAARRREEHREEAPEARRRRGVAGRRLAPAPRRSVEERRERGRVAAVRRRLSNENSHVSSLSRIFSWRTREMKFSRRTAAYLRLRVSTARPPPPLTRAPAPPGARQASACARRRPTPAHARQL